MDCSLRDSNNKFADQVCRPHNCCVSLFFIFRQRVLSYVSFRHLPVLKFPSTCRT